MDPNLVESFPLAAKIIVYVGTPMIVGLCTAIGVLWKAKESRDEYIRESDKANIQVLNNLTKLFEIMHSDISKLPKEVSKELSDLLIEIKLALKNNNDRHP